MIEAVVWYDRVRDGPNIWEMDELVLYRRACASVGIEETGRLQDRQSSVRNAIRSSSMARAHALQMAASAGIDPLSRGGVTGS